MRQASDAETDEHRSIFSTFNTLVFANREGWYESGVMGDEIAVEEEPVPAVV